MNTKKMINVGQYLATIWIMYIFLGSLPYKFSGHPHTEFIFSTIGAWISNTISWPIGNWFSSYAAYVIWTLELIVSIILIIALYFSARKMSNKASLFFWIGWLGAMFLMIWAAFFHLVTPLGIEVNGDWGSLFRAAVSIVVIGWALFAYNFSSIKKKFF
jgi:hypothetical protein